MTVHSSVSFVLFHYDFLRLTAFLGHSIALNLDTTKVVPCCSGLIHFPFSKPGQFNAIKSPAGLSWLQWQASLCSKPGSAGRASMPGDWAGDLLLYTVPVCVCLDLYVCRGAWMRWEVFLWAEFLYSSSNIRVFWRVFYTVRLWHWMQWVKLWSSLSSWISVDLVSTEIYDINKYLGDDKPPLLVKYRQYANGGLHWLGGKWTLRWIQTSRQNRVQSQGARNGFHPLSLMNDQAAISTFEVGICRLTASYFFFFEFRSFRSGRALQDREG